MAGRLTADALAAHQIVLNCASTTFMVPLGMSAAAAVGITVSSALIFTSCRPEIAAPAVRVTAKPSPLTGA